MLRNQAILWMTKFVSFIPKKDISPLSNPAKVCHQRTGHRRPYGHVRLPSPLGRPQRRCNKELSKPSAYRACWCRQGMLFPSTRTDVHDDLVRTFRRPPASLVKPHCRADADRRIRRDQHWYPPDRPIDAFGLAGRGGERANSSAQLIDSVHRSIACGARGQSDNVLLHVSPTFPSSS